MTNKTNRLYDDLAWLWSIWGDPAEEYADYCNHVVRLIHEHAQIPVRSLLNIGCGGGKNVYNLRQQYDVTGIDKSPEMLKLAKQLNPKCEFLQGDMRSFSLDRTFDAILMDDSISYMTSRRDLSAAFGVAFQHLKSGGIMVAAPDETTETFVQNRTVTTPAISRLKPDNLDVVFIENNYDPDPTDNHYEGTMVYLIREHGKLRVETDCHTLGLFSLPAWRETLEDAGFKVHEGDFADGKKVHVTFACTKP